MAGAALRGMGKVLAKHLRKTQVLGGLTARRGALRGTIKGADKYKGLKQPKKTGTYAKGVRKRIKGDPDSPIVGGLAAVAVGYGLGKLKGKKEAKAKETKEKLKKSTEEHKKKTKEKREKHGKPHA